MDFHEIWYLKVFRESVEKIQVSLKSEKNNGHCNWKPVYIYDIIPLNSSNEKCLRQNCRKKIVFNIVIAWKLGSIPGAPVLVKTLGVGVDPDSDPKIWFVADIVWGRERDAGHSLQLRSKIKAHLSYTFTFPTCHIASWGRLQEHMILAYHRYSCHDVFETMVTWCRVTWQRGYWCFRWTFVRCLENLMLFSIPLNFSFNH